MICTVTFNPAVDYVVHVDELTPGTICRAKSESIHFGGKGINVSLILRELGIESVATGFIAGFTGRAVADGIDGGGIKSDFVELESGCTRINVVTQHQHDLVAGVRVQRARRLIRKNDRAVTHEASGDRNALTLTTREALGEAISELGDANLFEGSHGGLAHLRRADPIQLQRHLNIFEGR